MQAQTTRMRATARCWIHYRSRVKAPAPSPPPWKWTLFESSPCSRSLRGTVLLCRVYAACCIMRKIRCVQSKRWINITYRSTTSFATYSNWYSCIGLIQLYPNVIFSEFRFRITFSFFNDSLVVLTIQIEELREI